MSGSQHPDRPATAAGPFPDAERQAIFAELADALIPAADGMPSAGAIVDDARVAFVLEARPDLADHLWAALQPSPNDQPRTRLAALERTRPDLLATLQLVVVAGYYSDATVRELIGYPGQTARPVHALDFPPYIAEGLIDQVVNRGPIWRNPTASTSTAEEG